jgi:hypothetical protein
MSFFSAQSADQSEVFWGDVCIYIWYSVYHTKFVKMRFIPVLLRVFLLFR